jgi:hypothetical protein
MESDHGRSGHPDIQQLQSKSVQSGRQAVAPLNKGDLAIVVLLSSLWLWAAVWAMTAPAFR